MSNTLAALADGRLCSGVRHAHRLFVGPIVHDEEAVSAALDGWRAAQQDPAQSWYGRRTLRMGAATLRSS